MSHTYDVIVVGAGPAGIFTALELTEKMPEARLLLIDSGLHIDRRACPARKLHRCVHCDPCNIMSGWAGAGAFSDGKLSLSEEVGGHIVDYLPRQEVRDLIAYADSIYLKHGAPDAGPRPQRPQGGRDHVRVLALQHTAHPLPGAPFGHGARLRRAARHVRHPQQAPRLRVPRAHHRRGPLGGGWPRGRRLHVRPGRPARAGARPLRGGRPRPRRRGVAFADGQGERHRDAQQRSGHRRARRGAQFGDGSPHPAPLRGQAGLLFRHL